MTSYLCIQVQKPADKSAVEQQPDGFDVSAQINLGCGCPVGRGGRLEPDAFRVMARVFGPEGTFHAETELMPAGFVSELKGVMPPLMPGEYELEVEAIDLETGLAGRKWIRFRVIPPPAGSRKA